MRLKVLLICFLFTVGNIFILENSNSRIRTNFENNFDENYLPTILESDQIIKHTAFTLCYSEEFEQAKWVAYRLTDSMCNNNGEERTNDFREDKDVKTHSAKPEDYKKSGYDRGHLCPAGDMGWSDITMSESFYMSNMSPQLPNFNRGIWKKLETNVREWAKREGELFVVTAGILNEKFQTIGGNKVSVPKYYYKVLLDHRLPQYKAIAFILPNEGSKEPLFKYVVSIDSVEKLTGIDFFPALPDSLEVYLERRSDPEQWK